MAEQEKFTSSKPHLNIGTIGHVDHGKTTTTAAILALSAKQGRAKKRTYEQINASQGSKSSKDEKREEGKGKTINSTHEEFETEKRHYSLIDCPGHLDYIKNMITGTAQMDGAILVVSARDGTELQTRKHMDLAKQIGVEYLVVFINKIDAVDPIQAELIKEDVKEELKKRGWEGFIYEKGKWKEGEYNPDPKKVPVVVGSALCAIEEREPEIGENSIIQLLEVVDNHVPTPKRDEDKPFLMWIENKYKIPGIGTVATGRVERGKIERGKEIEIIGLGPNLETTVKGIQAFRKIKDAAVAGDDAGIALSGIDFEKVGRGQVLAAPGKVASHTKFAASVYIFKPEEGGRRTPFGSGFRPQFFFKTVDVTGTIKLESDDKLINPREVKEAVEMEVELESNIFMEKGSKFIIWEGKVSVGGGTVTKIIE